MATSELYSLTPSRASGSPAQPQQLFPRLFGSITAQVFPPLKQGGLTVGHLSAVIDIQQPLMVRLPTN